MLAPNDVFQEHYRISYVADEQPGCTLYRAYDEHAARSVLLAELPQDDAEALHEAETLAHATADLSAPGLLVLRHWFHAGQALYMVVDDPGGQDFARAVHSEAVRAAAQPAADNGVPGQVGRLLGVFEVLHAHQPPLLVGDLLTSDIWAAPDGSLSVAPFAVLRPIGQERATYQAPELADAQAAPTPASDLYALGAVYYHLLTGWAPPAAALRSAGTPLNAPRELNAHISPMLERVLLRLLDMEPGERYQSVGELRHALELVHMIEDGMSDGMSGTAAAPPTAEQAAEAGLSDTEAGAAVLGSRQEFLPPAVAATSSTPPAAIVPATPTPAAPAAEAPPEDGICLLLAAGLLLVVAIVLGAALSYFLVGPGVDLLFDRADELLRIA
jgi:hypothetical protein